MVETYRNLQVRKMKVEEVGEKIAKHCEGYDLFFTINFLKKDDMEKAAVKLAQNMKGLLRHRNLEIFSGQALVQRRV